MTDSRGHASGLDLLIAFGFEMSNDGDGTLHWNARFLDDWLNLEPSTGSIPPGGDPVVVTLTADPNELTNGMNSSFIEVGSSYSNATIEVGVQIHSLTTFFLCEQFLELLATMLLPQRSF